MHNIFISSTMDDLPKERDIFEKQQIDEEIVFTSNDHTNVYTTSLSNKLNNRIPSKEAMSLGYSLLIELDIETTSKRINYNTFELVQDPDNLILFANDKKLSKLLRMVKKDMDSRYASFLKFIK